MTTPEAHRWEEGDGIGSAKCFGDELTFIRENYEADIFSWAALAQINPAYYVQMEYGDLETRPDVEELNQWCRGWRLTRSEIGELKYSGGYDISAYWPGNLSGETLGRAIVELKEESRRELMTLHGIKFLVGSFLGRIFRR